MMYMTAGIQMETIFGDGSSAAEAGFMGALLGAGKRLLTGEIAVHDGVHQHRRRHRRTSPSPRPTPAASWRWTSRSSAAS